MDGWLVWFGIQPYFLLFISFDPQPVEYQENGHAANGLDADDSDSELISVSAQPTPRIHRKYSPSAAQQPRQATSSGSQHHHHHPPGRDTEVQTPMSAPAAQNFQRHAARSAQDLSKPPPYQRHGYTNGLYHSGGSGSGAVPHGREAREAREGTAQRAAERQPSGESSSSIVDAYGLVIHGRDDTRRGGDRGGGQGDEGPQGGVYSNWKLQYFSAPNISRAVTAGPQVGGGRHDERGGPAVSVTSGAGGVSDGYDDSEVFEDRPAAVSPGVPAGPWTSDYPFNKRALYRGHENAAVIDRGDTTLPVRSIHSPPTLAESGRGGGKVPQRREKPSLRTPDPDYTPVATPRGSTRSLNTEIARVLRDFENTLRAHEPSRPPSSVAEVGPVAFV